VDDHVIDPVDVDIDDGNDDADEWAAEQMMRPDIRFFRDGRTLETPDNSIPQFIDRAEHKKGRARLYALSFLLRFFNELIITTFVSATNAYYINVISQPNLINATSKTFASMTVEVPTPCHSFCIKVVTKSPRRSASDGIYGTPPARTRAFVQ
jgi:hypothetical protein